MLTTNTLRSGFLGLLLATVGCGGSADGGPGLGNLLGGGPGGDPGGGPGGDPGVGSDAGGSQWSNGSDGGGTNPPHYYELDDGGLVCEAQVVRSERVTPDLMIVVDRSASMKMNGINRWDPSVNAVESITGALDDTIRFGLMTFPSNSRCGAGRVDVEIGSNTAAAISDRLQDTSPGGYTPTAVTLQNAHEALGTGLSGPDEFVPPKYVLLVTDGQPNCENGRTGSGSGQESQVQASVDAIAAMAADGIKTYVIGYDTQDDAGLKSALDRMAKAGGTGDEEHRPVEDEDSLRETLEQIAGTAISCEFQLETPPADPSYVEITMDGDQLFLDQPNGWQLSEDGRRVTLLGDSCAKLKAGGNHTVGVRVLCDIVVPF